MKEINWQPDHLGDGFEMTYVNHPDDYSGQVRSTVIRKLAARPSQKAVLYVHGFSDYFLQKGWPGCSWKTATISMPSIYVNMAAR